MLCSLQVKSPRTWNTHRRKVTRQEVARDDHTLGFRKPTRFCMDHHAQDPDPSLPLPIFAQTALLNAFRIHYTRFQTQISELDGTTTDATVIARLGDDFDEFARLVEEVSGFLLKPSCVYFIV